MTHSFLFQFSLILAIGLFPATIHCRENGVKIASRSLAIELNKYGVNAISAKSVPFILGSFSFSETDKDINQNGFPEYFKEMVASEIVNYPRNHLFLARNGTTNNLAITIAMPKENLIQLFPVLMLGNEKITFEVIEIDRKDVPERRRPSLPNIELSHVEYTPIPNEWPSPIQGNGHYKENPKPRRPLWRKICISSVAVFSIVGFVMYFGS